jgi:tRNA (guanine-N7-)-methyltransferase
VNGPSSDERITWRDVFGNMHPVEIEIGPGRGDVLLGYAGAAPGTNFFGLERLPGAAEAIMQRAVRRGLTNVRVIAGDARCIVARCVPDASVTAYHVYFPDPWPKTRHRRRRLATVELGEVLRRTLVIGGVVHVASDLRDLLEEICHAFTRAGLVRARDAAPPAGRATTAFERRYASAGTHYARLLRPT